MIIYSPTSLKINNLKTDDSCINFSTKDLTQNVIDINKKIYTLSNIDMVIAFGGGTSIDLAKYIGFRLNVKVIVIPTMISTNAYVTDKVALYVSGKKVTLLAKSPDVILMDKNVLKKSSLKNVYGLVDVLSIYTALNDWDLAIKCNNESISKEYSYAHELLLETLNFINSHTYNEICNDIYTILILVGKAGVITNIYGNGKPESGSEHIFSKELEAIKIVPHAISVSNGILLMSLLQNKFSKEIYNAIIKLKIFKDEHIYGIDQLVLKKAFFNVSPRKDRYSIINQNNCNYEKIFRDFIKIKKGEK